VDMLETVELEDTMIENQIRELYVKDRLTYKEIVDDTKKKLAGRIDVVDNYYDRFVTSMPISIPLRKVFHASHTGGYKTSDRLGSSVGSSVGSGGGITDSIYKYISYSIGNIKKYTVG
jgi:hypothetical protein